MVIVTAGPECHPDHVLVSAALRSEQKAMRELVGRLTPVIQARVAQLLIRSGRARGRGISQEVADLTQEVFMALFAGGGRTLRAWDPNAGATLEGFVSLVAHRQAISVLRSRRKSPLQPTTEDSSELDNANAESSPADRALAAKADVVRIADALRTRLSENGIEMFYALFLLEETVAEVSERTGQSVAAIYQWRSRIKKLILAIAAEDASETSASDSEMIQAEPAQQSAARRAE